MSSKVTIDLVTDTRDFERQMKSAAKATNDFEGAADKVGHGLGDARSQIKGTQSLLKGLHQVLDSNTQAAIDTLSGYANLAKGLKAGLIPAVKQGSAAFATMSKAMLASPWGKVGLAVAAVATVVVATTKDTDAMGSAFNRMKAYGESNIKTFREWGNTALSTFGLGKEAAVDFGYSMDELFYSTEAVGEAALTMAAHAKSAADTFGAAIEADIQSTARLDAWLKSAARSALALKIAYQLGGTVDDPDGAFASAAAVAAMNDTMSGPIIDPKGFGGPKVKKTAKKVAKTVAETWRDEFEQAFKKRSPLEKLQDALEKFKTKLDNAKGIKRGLKDLFKLDFAVTDYTNVPAGLKMQLARWEQFVKVFAQLKKKGLAPSLLTMFADAGPAALEEMNKVNHASIGDINKVNKRAQDLADSFARSETIRRTKVDPDKPKPVKVEFHIKGNSGDLKNLIKKWVREEGGGDVQVAFGK